MQFNLYRRRKAGGQSLTELAANLIWLVPLLLGLFDLAVLFICVNANDAAVRDAARAAANGTPRAYRGRQPDIRQRAVAVLTRSYKVGGFITPPEESNIVVDYIPNQAGGTEEPDAVTGGPWPGSVEVRSSVTITLPVQVPFVADDPIPFTSQARFPCTRIEQPTTPAFL